MAEAGPDRDSAAAIKAALIHRIAALSGPASSLGSGDMAREIGAIRLLAHRHDLKPAVTVAHFLEWAVARGEQGLLLMGGLAMLGEAVISEQQDPAACEAFAAACSVRLAEA